MSNKMETISSGGKPLSDEELMNLLMKVRSGELSPEEAERLLNDLPGLGMDKEEYQMSTKEKKSRGYKGLGMDGPIASWYAKITQKDIEEYKSNAKLVAEQVSAGDAILEVAPGPGYLAIELAKLGHYKIVGLDISKTFVEIAQTKAKEAGVEVDFRQGNVAQMPFDEGIFDFIICKSAFKNFAEPTVALDEMYRVLKVGGKALILDLRGDVSEETVNDYVENMGLNSINSLITKWIFKFSLIKRAYTKDQFKTLASKTKFSQSEIQENQIGLEVWLEK
jgi:ubiquinone/menaquinone biosynthesis C-methylase UbiE